MRTTLVTKHYFDKKKWSVGIIRKLLRDGAMQNIALGSGPTRQRLIEMAEALRITKCEAEEWRETERPIERIRRDMAAAQSRDSGNGAAGGEENEQIQIGQDDVMDQDEGMDQNEDMDQNDDVDGSADDNLNVSAEQTGIDTGTSEDTGDDAESVTLAPFSPQIRLDGHTQRLTANEPPFQRSSIEGGYDQNLKGRLHSFK